MNIYIAKSKNEKYASHLSNSEQMDKYIKAGWSIYEFDIKTSEERLIATPEDGFLVEKPVFPERHTIQVGGQ